MTPSDLTALAAVPGVTAVNPVREPMLSAPVSQMLQPAICEGGSVLSEGINQLGVVGVGPNGEAIGAREKFSVRGAGETVGVLSDSYNVLGGAPTDVSTDDLPGVETGCSGQATPVNVLEEGPAGSEDEGRAMLQIVHDIAPHAKLAFASAFAGELAMAQNIERLAAPASAGGAGADVIVDDVTYLEEPMFQDGPIAVAVNKVTAQGVTYLTSAGNNNNNISGVEEEVMFHRRQRKNRAQRPDAEDFLGNAPVPRSRQRVLPDPGRRRRAPLPQLQPRGRRGRQQVWLQDPCRRAGHGRR